MVFAVRAARTSDPDMTGSGNLVDLCGVQTGIEPDHLPIVVIGLN